MISDGDLMLTVKSGNLEAFDEIILRHSKPLINYFYKLVWSRETAEDLSQEVFCQIFRYVNKYEQTAKFTTFLYRIAHNQYVDYLRKTNSRLKTMSLETVVKEENVLLESVASTTDDPLKKASSKEIAEIIQKKIQHIDEIYREPFILCVNQGLKYSEASKVLEIPEGTVKSRMFTAVRKLRQLLNPIVNGSKVSNDSN